MQHMGKTTSILVIAVAIFSFVSAVSAQGLPFEPPSAKAAKAPQISTSQQESESYISLYKGSLAYSYKIEVPPGTRGLQPELSLNYDSRAAKGKSTWCGLGWDLNLSYIQRDVNYTPDDLTDDKFDLILNGSKYDLVYISSEGRYHTKVESHLWIKKLTGGPNQEGEYWVVRDKEGNEHRFGYNLDSENIASTRDYVWRWSLDQIKDANDNTIFYSYEENPNENDIGAVYLSEIRYNNDELRSIRFLLEETDKPDAYFAYVQGSKIRKTRRLKEIDVFVNDDRVRKYVLEYTASPYTSRSLLHSITQTGMDGISALPPTTFSYKEGDFGFEPPASWTDPGTIQMGDEANLQSNTFDINRDGLSDYAQAFVGDNWGVRFNNGSAFDSEIPWNAPDYWIHHNDETNAYDTFDINGDNLPDFVYANGIQDWTVYLNNGQGFDEPIIMSAPEGWIGLTGNQPSDSVYYDTFDINGDGLPDFVKKGAGSDWLVYLNTIENFREAQNWNAFGHYISEFEIPIESGPEECEEACIIECFGVCEGECEDICEDECSDWCQEACGDCEEECYPECFDDCYEIYGDDEYCDQYCREEYCPEMCANCEDECEDEHCGPGGDWMQMCQEECENQCQDECWVMCREQCEGYYVLAQEKFVYVDTFDINGDGLADLVYAASISNWNVYLNNGNGFDQPIGWNAVSSSIRYSEIEEGNYYVRKSVFDINTDGLPDYVIADYPNQFWRVFLNTGEGFGSQIIWDLNTQEADALQSGNYFSGWDKSIDLNGDGASDFVKSDNGWNVYSNRMAGVDLLAEIHSSEGGIINVEYTPSTQYDNTGDDDVSDLGFTYWCVSSVAKDNGMDGAHHAVTTYNYEYADGLYDHEDKEFRGFGYVKATESSGDYSEHYFHQDDARKGRNYLTENKDDQGNIYSKSEHTWDYQILFTTPEEVYFTYLNQEDAYSYDGDPENPKIARVQYTAYDNYGNVQEINYQGDIDVQGDEKYLYNEYVYNLDIWIVDTLQHSYLNSSDDLTKVKEGWYSYDDGAVGDPPTRGNLTELEEWLDAGVNPITTYAYDEHGNKTHVTDAEGNTTIATYDDIYHTFAVQVQNAKGQIATNTHDHATGNLLSTTDPNGFVTSYEYDIFKRLIKETQPYDSANYPTVSYQYFVDGTAPEGILVSKREISGQAGTLDTYSFNDGFGRVVQTRAEAEDITKQIVIDTYYDSIEKIDRISVPYLSDKITDYGTPDLSARNVSYEYDPLKRIIKITNTDETYKTNNYYHWAVTQTNEKNIPIDFTYDVYARLMKVQEHNQQEIYTTTYEYDTRDNLTKITDNQNNETILEYDSLCRKIAGNDPDMGTWVYAYDKVGNLITQTDAKGITIGFKYDELNRLTKKDYSEGVDTSYIYDIETLGTLSLMSDSSGMTHYYYDERKRKITEETSVDSETYVTQRSYDAMDRVVNITYPDEEQVNYIYNSQGKIEVITGYVNNIDYNAKGNITRKEYANGLYVELTYNEDDFRLNRIYTPVLQDLAFTYDDHGNILVIADSIRSITQSFLYDDLDRLVYADGVYGTKIYDYDSIGNVILKDGASYIYGESAGPHAITSGSDGSAYNYDANGNMVNRSIDETVQIYEYDIDNRLTKVKINGKSRAKFEYNGNGDRTKKIIYAVCPQGASLNKLQPSFYAFEFLSKFMVKEAEAAPLYYEQDYHEGGGGIPPTETLYVGSLYEKEKRGYVTRSTTKHIFLEDERVVSKDAEDTFYYHPDHLGSSDIVTDQSASQVQRLEYAPYGEVILNEGENATNYKFTGKELDETGLYFYGARYYDPKIGRFITVDPLENIILIEKNISENQLKYRIYDVTNLYIKEAIFHVDVYPHNLHNPQELNKYSYCLGNPVNYIDPSGLKVTLGERSALWIGSHTAIVLQPDNPQDFQGHPSFYKNQQGKLESIVSAGPKGGKLTRYPFNFAPDRPQNLRNMRIIKGFQNRSDTDFIKAVLDSADKYKDDLSYGAFAIGEDYNSNSYIAGILKDATGEDVSVDFPLWQPGGDKPIPLNQGAN